MKYVEKTLRNKPHDSEQIKIGSTTYVVNSYNRSFSKSAVKAKILGCMENDIRKKV